MGEADSRPTAKTHSEPCGPQRNQLPVGGGWQPEVTGPAPVPSLTTGFPGGSVGFGASCFLPLLEGFQGSQRARGSSRAPTACPPH